MAVALVKSAKFANNTTAVASGSVTLASAPTSGNYLVGYIVCYSNLGSVTPTGWTEILHNQMVGSGFIDLRVFYKVSDGTETSTTVALASSSDFFSAAIAEYSGVTGIDTFNSNKSSTDTATNLANTSLTGLVVGDMVMSISGTNKGKVASASYNLTCGAGYTRQQFGLSDYNASAFATANSLTADTTTGQGTTWTETNATTGFINSLVLLRSANPSSPYVVQQAGQKPIAKGTLDLALAATPVVGNVLVVFAAYSQFSTARTIGTPAGWTKVLDVTGSTASANADSLAVFWRLVQSGDGKTYTFTISGATNDDTTGAIYEVAGASTTAPINAFGSTTNVAASAATTTTASVTPSVVGTLPLAAIALDNHNNVYSSLTALSTNWRNGFIGWDDYHPIFTVVRPVLTTDTTTAISNTFTLTTQSSDGGATAIVLIAPPAAPATTTVSTALMMGV